MRQSTVWIILWFLIPGGSAFSRGSKCIPQVADGVNVRTKFDLINVSPNQEISNFTLSFYTQSGMPWALKTNLGQGSTFTLKLNPRQVLRVETSGASSPSTSGYAIIQDNELNTSYYSTDFVLGITTYYEVSSGGRAVDTISVPVTSPTALGTLPVEVRKAAGLDTGIALVNLTSSPNQVHFSLYPSGTGTAASGDINLEPNQQRSEFLYEHILPSLNNQDFKGIVEFKAQGPLAILALLQTQTANGVQYATLVPTDREALRRNSYMIVPQAVYVNSNNPTMPADLDNFTVDFYRMGGDESYPWDMIYRSVDKTTRRLETATGNGAAFAILGVLEDNAIDAVSLPRLRGLTYNSDPIDLSDGSPNLLANFSFAVITDLGNYAKVRLISTSSHLDSQGNPYVDLMLEVTVFR